MDGTGSGAGGAARRGDGGVLLGAFLAGEAAAGALERLGGAWGERLRAGQQELAAVPREVRRAALRKLSAALRSPLPEGYEALDIVDLARRLEGVHPQVAAAVVLALPPPLPAELQRYAQVACHLPVALRLRVAQQELADTLAAQRTVLALEKAP